MNPAAIDSIQDEASFLSFVDALIADRTAFCTSSKANQSKTSGWHNGTIEDFLESGVAWARDSKFGQHQGLNDANPWRKFAAFLYAGKIYE